MKLADGFLGRVLSCILALLKIVLPVVLVFLIALNVKVLYENGQNIRWRTAYENRETCRVDRLTEDELRFLAYHEAAHAYVSEQVRPGSLVEIELYPHGRINRVGRCGGGETRHITSYQTRDDVIGQFAIAFAGPVYDSLSHNGELDESQTDLQQIEADATWAVFESELYQEERAQSRELQLMWLLGQVDKKALGFLQREKKILKNEGQLLATQELLRGFDLHHVLGDAILAEPDLRLSGDEVRTILELYTAGPYLNTCDE